MSIQLDDLDTGDIILFIPAKKSHHGFMQMFDWLIQNGTGSPYTHVGFVLKDPIFIHPSLKGLYLWESGYEGTPDPQDGEVKLGVQITPLHQCANSFQGDLYVRRMTSGRSNITPEILRDIHDVVYHKPYDTFPKDWVEALLRVDDDPQKTDRFWCSALVSYILVRLGMLDKDLDWSIIRPSDLSSNSDFLQFRNGCSFCNDTCLIK